MIADDRGPGQVPASPPAPIVHWACLGGVLLVEMVAIGSLIGSLFEPRRISGQVHWWLRFLFIDYPSLPTLCLASLAALLLIYARRFWEQSTQQSEQSVPSALPTGGEGYAPFWPLFLGHLLLFGAFAALTAMVLKEDMRLSSWPGAWALAWGVLGLASLALWGAAAFPIGLWRWLLRSWWLVFPTACAVGFAAVAAGKLADRFWEPLGHGALWVVGQVYHLAGQEVRYDPVELRVGTGSFLMKIGPGCSGFEGIGLICVFLGVYLWLFRQEFRFPRALLLFPLGVLIIYLANVLRLVLLVAIGTWVSHDVAAGGFHSQAGWLAFLGVSLGLATVAQRRVFSSAPAPEELAAPNEAAGASNPAAPYLAPVLVLVAVCMITRAFSAGFDHGYPLRVLAVAGAVWIYRHQYKGLDLFRTWSWTASRLVPRRSRYGSPSSLPRHSPPRTIYMTSWPTCPGHGQRSG